MTQTNFFKPCNYPRIDYDIYANGIYWDAGHVDIVDNTSNRIRDLELKFEILSNSVNDVLLKLQECAKRESLVDDAGGALDEFIEQFVR